MTHFTFKTLSEVKILSISDKKSDACHSNILQIKLVFWANSDTDHESTSERSYKVTDFLSFLQSAYSPFWSESMLH